MNALLFGLSVVISQGLRRPEPVTVPVKEIVAEKVEVCSDDEAEDCANCSNGMEGSVKAYDRHIILCDMKHDWPKSIDSNKFFPYNLVSRLDENKKNGLKVTITGCRHIANCEDDEVYVIMYPDNIAFTLKESHFDAFSDLVYSKEKHQLDQLQSLPFKAAKPFTDKLIVVCTHKRDSRCYTIGPQLVVEFRQIFKEQNLPESIIAVRQSSHIGGHIFAGTLIIYPEGVWYGKLTAKSVKHVVKAIQENRKYAKCFRGQAGGKSIEW